METLLVWNNKENSIAQQESQRPWKMGLVILCGVTSSLCTLTTKLLNTAGQFSAKKVLNWTMKGMCARFISSRITKHRTWLSQPSLKEVLQSASQILYFSHKWRSTEWPTPHLSQRTHQHNRTLGVRKTLLTFQLVKNGNKPLWAVCLCTL